MEFSGHCYCGKIHYHVAGEPVIKVQCHCRECQYLSGGGANVTIGMPAAGFAYTQGTPKQFARADLANNAWWRARRCWSMKYCPACRCANGC
jgi:hypothetical protein